MYDWRKMTNEQRADALELRRLRGFPKHSPPHWDLEAECQYLISASCYEHSPFVGKTPERMTEISFSGFVRPIFLKCWLLLAGDKLFFHSWPVEEH